MISTALNPQQSVCNSLSPFWYAISICCLEQSVWKVVYAAQIKYRECRKILTNGQSSLYLLTEEMPWLIFVILYHWASNRGKYADGLYNCMINDKDGHILLPLIMYTCTVLRHALLEWQQYKGVHQKASKSKLKAVRPDRSNYFNYKNASGKTASRCAATGRKLSTSPGIADMYPFLTNTWNTLLESYQQRVYKSLYLQSSVRSNRQRTQCLPVSSAWKQRVLTMLFFLTI